MWGDSLGSAILPRAESKRDRAFNDGCFDWVLPAVLQQPPAAQRSRHPPARADRVRRYAHHRSISPTVMDHMTRTVDNSPIHVTIPATGPQGSVWSCLADRAADERSRGDRLAPASAAFRLHPKDLAAERSAHSGLQSGWLTPGMRGRGRKARGGGLRPASGRAATSVTRIRSHGRGGNRGALEGVPGERWSLRG